MSVAVRKPVKGHGQLDAGLIRLHVLQRARQRPLIARRLAEELAERGYDVSAGTLYPILRRLEANGLLRSERAARSGRTYRLTPEGRRVWAAARPRICGLLGALAGDQEVPAGQ